MLSEINYNRYVVGLVGHRGEADLGVLRVKRLGYTHKQAFFQHVGQ